jgi:hypothetical protein
MFKKSEPGSKLKGSSPPPAPGAQSTGLARASARSAPTVIGPDLTIKGELISKGELQIDDEVQGNIRGPRGRPTKNALPRDDWAGPRGNVWVKACVNAASLSLR